MAKCSPEESVCVNTVQWGMYSNARAKSGSEQNRWNVYVEARFTHLIKANHIASQVAH